MSKKKGGDSDVTTLPTGEAIYTPGPSEQVLGSEVAPNGKPKLSKRERFLKYAPKRTQNALDKLRQLAACANRGGYEYSDAEAAKIMDAVANGVTQLRNKFAGAKEARQVFAL